MRILNLNDIAVKRLRQTLPCFKNTRVLARGTFCVVFDMPDKSRVLKLTTDRVHYAYLTDNMSPGGSYKPLVLEDHGMVGETIKGSLALYLVEVERLQPIPSNTDNSRLVRRMVRYARSKGSRAYPSCTTQVKGLSDTLAEFCGELNNFVGNFGCSIDPVFNNFMERADGTLVMSDPVYDFKMLHDCQFRMYDAKVGQRATYRW